MKQSELGNIVANGRAAPTGGKMKNDLLIFSLVLASTLAASPKDKPKDPRDYPLTGTVVSFHAEKELRGSMEGDEGEINTITRRVYVLKTDTGQLEITGWDSQRHLPFAKSKAAKRPPLSIGQKIQFRTDGKFIWTVLDDGVEHRYYINSASN
jgi:hypothetical protein